MNGWRPRRSGRCTDPATAQHRADAAIRRIAGAAAAATFVYAGPDARARLDAARSLLAEGVRCGATCVNGTLVARWLAPEPAPLRRAFGAFWAGFRAEAGGLPARLPRLWEV